MARCPGLALQPARTARRGNGDPVTAPETPLLIETEGKANLRLRLKEEALADTGKDFAQEIFSSMVA
jgi:hypothetical protein